ncbi:hypothetical protein HC256_008941 [Beauveria bassiana]|nr:hypothetical protein HC256_008941 [Beauveria bassiana]
MFRGCWLGIMSSYRWDVISMSCPYLSYESRSLSRSSRVGYVGPEPGSGLEISIECRGAACFFRFLSKQKAITATATTTIATPMPIPAAAPDVIPEEGTGEDVGEVSLAALVEVLERPVVVAPDYCHLVNIVLLVAVVTGAAEVLGVVEVVDVDNAGGVDAGLDVRLGDADVGDGDTVEDDEGGGVLAAGWLVEADVDAGEDGDAETRAAGNLSAWPASC